MVVLLLSRWNFTKPSKSDVNDSREISVIDLQSVILEYSHVEKPTLNHAARAWPFQFNYTYLLS